MNKYATQKAEECWNKAIDPDKSEYECFFHYEDDMLFKAGFEQALKLLQGSMVMEMMNLTAVDETTYKDIRTETFKEWIRDAEKEYYDR